MASGEKVLCPWCGAEMYACYSRGRVLWECRDYYDAHLRCTKCGAQGPFESWNTAEGAKEAARAAAMRRYTPPLKPMTRQELPRVYLMPCWIERIGEKAYPDLLDKNSVGFFGKFENLNARERDYLLYTNYGRTWRCWARRPTDDERSAALWEM